MDTGDYNAAVSEFKRFAFFFPKDPRVPEALFDAGTACFRLHRYSEAVRLFQTVFEKYTQSDFAIKSAFMISRSFAAAGEPKSAIAVLNRLYSSNLFSVDVRDEAAARAGWLYLKTGDYRSAEKAFVKISGKDREKYHAPAILKDLKDRRERISVKSPLLAGICGIVPGGGYLYCGRLKDAAMAFFINTSLAVATYESIDKRIYALGGMLGLVNIGFYGGSIYGGITSAYKYNAREERRFLQGLEERYGPSEISLHTHRSGVFLAFCLKF